MNKLQQQQQHKRWIKFVHKIIELLSNKVLTKWYQEPVSLSVW